MNVKTFIDRPIFAGVIPRLVLAVAASVAPVPPFATVKVPVQDVRAGNA